MTRRIIALAALALALATFVLVGPSQSRATDQSVAELTGSPDETPEPVPWRP